MKKLITILLTLLLALSLCACDSGKKEPTAKAQASGPAFPVEPGTPASEMTLPESTGSDLTWEEIEQILAEMEAAEAEGQ